ncbi:hypothetical protein MIMGU_mgv1a023792mg [Erythranthe guttata]|uniref:Uncharacterized protein n=1 Tax=Erythranthe guttata TaxID=4155 RepID=A0A022RVD7_ERYGU|nr:hypothetical protein MIMGU_mgv1a023792mg [Erythranthe guttata]
MRDTASSSKQKNFFGKGWYFKPWDTRKTPTFYQATLETTGSTAFKNFFREEQHNDPAYSTCKIFKIISPSNWEYDLFQPLHFPEFYKNSPFFEMKFNYWDYQQAWYNAFPIQNHKHKHTRLFYFDKICDSTTFPSWFNQWWNLFGSTPEIISPATLNSYNLFREKFKPSDTDRRFHPLCLFCSKFFLPWVLGWTVEYTNDTTLVIQRKFRVKWWSKFKIPPSLSETNVQKWIANNGSSPKQVPQNTHYQQSEFLNQKSKMTALLAAATSPEEMQAILSKFTPLQQESSS